MLFRGENKVKGKTSGKKTNTMKHMRNQPSEKTGKVDTVDRHTKGRLIIIDSNLLLTYSAQDYTMLIIDIAELSDYYDCLITCKPGEVEYIKQFCEHWALKADVSERFTNYEEILEKYRILVCFTTKADRDDYKKYYRCDTLSR